MTVKRIYLCHHRVKTSSIRIKSCHQNIIRDNHAANDEQSYHLEQPTLRQALILIGFKI